MTNEINYIDFEPQILEKNFWGNKTYETTSMVMERVNEWVRKNYNREIINVETIIVPKSSSSLKNTNTSKLNMQGGIVYMIETIRVWYK
ncbi:hypothetical protein A9Q93_05715 [Nonlabens dokdonensis]|uniref:Uncharacterized protein n=1 Tax=Nonlabens dokdonensis TaxID=328515 RepID=A0A1Z8B1Q8_9FLAO|nr:hypothetical protein [Nonlabens dokdonensis]OUS16512.1 hypothetical protein A9Q93_05715 [Nonlabens dokdonensis]